MRSPHASVLLLCTLTAALGSSSPAFASDDSSDDVEAGGLKPPSDDTAPPSSKPSDAPSETQRDLQTSDEKDSGRGLEFVYFDVEGGYQQVSLNSLKTTNVLVPKTVSSSDAGPMFGVGAGVRLLFITVGPRFRLGHFKDWDLWSLNLEGGMHIPLGSFEPYFTLGGGFTKLGQVSQAGLSTDSGVTVRGYNIRGGVGADYYVTSVFSVGANITGEVMGLTRPKVDVSTLTQNPVGNPVGNCMNVPPDQVQACAMMQANNAAAQAYKLDGSSIGTSATFSLVLGLHF